MKQKISKTHQTIIITKEVLPIKNAIQKLYPNWTITLLSNSFIEFKLFKMAIDQTQIFMYFKLHATRQSAAYDKQRHKTIFEQFKSVLINIFVREVSHSYKQRQFLLRAQQNYITLAQIKCSNLRKSEIESFVVKLIGFFGKILEMTSEFRLKIRVHQFTVFINQDKDFKLGDYNIFFTHPHNRQEDDAKYEDIIFDQMIQLILFIVSKNGNQNSVNLRDVSHHAIRQLLQLDDEDRSAAQSIISNFLQHKAVNYQEIQEYFRQHGCNQNAESMRQQNQPLNGQTRSQISIPLNFSISYQQHGTSSFSQATKSLRNVRKSKKKPWRIAPIVGMLLVALFIVGLVTFLVFRTKQCGEHQYPEGGKCYQCAESCKSCQKGSENDCIECEKDEWLVIKTRNNTVGFCSRQCFGEKDYDTMHCILQFQYKF